MSNVTFFYDRDADILYINQCPPYAEQESEELDGDIVARFNPETGEVENLELLFFSKRLQNSQVLELPIQGKFLLNQ